MINGIGAIMSITLKGIFRDRVFHGIMALAILFLGIPAAASLSMRQVTELSITLSLSLISFILLLLAVFLASTSIWRDMERRYTFSVLSLPLSRPSYLLGRFCGISLFMLLTATVLGCGAAAAIKVSSGIYPSEKPFDWGLIVLSIGFDACKYILLAAVGLLLSTFSTSFFLPVFGTISIFFAGSAIQQVYDYVNSPSVDKNLSPIVKQCANALYYILPNLDSFNLKVNAIYTIAVNWTGILTTFLYFIVYVGMVMSLASLVFSRREMK